MGADSRPRHRAEDEDDRALERLVERTTSRLGVDGAMRARDVSRPTPEDLAAARAEDAARPNRPPAGR